jgi:hypothetical protein
MQPQNGNGDHPQEESTKCGYKSHRGKNCFLKNPVIFWATCWNHPLSKYGYFRRKKHNSCDNFGALFIVFIHKIPLNELHLVMFLVS